MGRMKQQASRQPEPIIADDRWEALAVALQPLDAVAVAMEGKWGGGRLPRLVSVELAAKFGRARDALNEAIRANDVAEVERKAGALIRGWQALDKAATEAGAEQLPSRTWGVTHEGRNYTIVLDRGDVDKVARMDPAPGRVVTVNELLIAWQWHHDRTSGMIDAVKATFKGEQVTRLDERKGDELAF